MSRRIACPAGLIGRPEQNCIILTEGWPRAIVALVWRVITLLTDFGLKDGYVGVMKGVIWGIAPQAQIADITHQIRPQNVPEGALALGRVAAYFPAGTVHLAVVDPGVGTQRRPIAARLGEQYFVGPDNGLCTLLVEAARRSNAAGPVRPPGPPAVLAARDQQGFPRAGYLFAGRRPPGQSVCPFPSWAARSTDPNIAGISPTAADGCGLAGPGDPGG